MLLLLSTSSQAWAVILQIDWFLVYMQKYVLLQSSVWQTGTFNEGKLSIWGSSDFKKVVWRLFLISTIYYYKNQHFPWKRIFFCTYCKLGQTSFGLSQTCCLKQKTVFVFLSPHHFTLFFFFFLVSLSFGQGVVFISVYGLQKVCMYAIIPYQF